MTVVIAAELVGTTYGELAGSALSLPSDPRQMVCPTSPSRIGEMNCIAHFDSDARSAEVRRHHTYLIGGGGCALAAGDKRERQ